jgi:hypothetical protein
MICVSRSPVERSVHSIGEIKCKSILFLAGAKRTKTPVAESIHGLPIWNSGELTVERMRGKLQPRRRYARLETRVYRNRFRRPAWSFAAGGCAWRESWRRESMDDVEGIR